MLQDETLAYAVRRVLIVESGAEFRLSDTAAILTITEPGRSGNHFHVGR
jgi:hypothetical protein